MASQLGTELAPAGELPFTIAEMFGHGAPSPLVMTGGADDNNLMIGGYDFPHAAMSGVVTVDVDNGATNPLEHQSSARNLLRPMHSEGFWILILGLVVVGLFSGSGNLKLGPVRLSGGVGGSA